MMMPKASLNRVTYALKTTVVLTSIRAAFYATSTVADGSIYGGVNKHISLHCRKPGSQRLPKLAGTKILNNFNL